MTRWQRPLFLTLLAGGALATVLAVRPDQAPPPPGEVAAVELRSMRETIRALGLLEGTELRVAVAEVDAARLAVDQRAELLFDAAPTAAVTATVVAIDARAVTVDGRTILPAVVRPNGPLPVGIRSGMTASVTIVVRARDAVPAIELGAVRQQGATTTVLRPDGTSVPVELGLRDGRWIEVVDGLAPGDRYLGGPR